MESRKIKILVIDDNNDNLITIQALIKEAFPEAITILASNGVKGLQLSAIEDPDVILLDIIMPDMDGYDVCRKLKADNNLKDIPV
ncbi:MAG: response regulator, partial [Bacteroidota bacterium]